MMCAITDKSYSGLVPCTLYSGHYHYGVGALANSLYRNGFRGTMCVGYIPPLPPWAAGAQRDGDHIILEVNADFHLRFIAWPTEQNLTFEKARFLLHILDEVEPEAEGALFFDADIAVHGNWQFFEEWLRQGVALCLDLCYPLVPARHPWRAGWRALAMEAGYDSSRNLEYYVNGGFVGVPRAQRELLECWVALIDTFLHQQSSPVRAMKLAERENAFGSDDQDMLNAAVMATSVPLSIIGQEGMDFAPAGYTMSHAVSGVKPWRMNFIAQALAAHPPAMADKTFWHYADYPIPLFSPLRITLTRLAIKMASAIGRFYGRS